MNNHGQTVKDVTNFLFIKDGKVLLGMKKRGFGVNKFNGFGGKLKTGETILEAALREAKEEAGLTPTVYEKYAIIDFSNSYPLRMHLFVASAWEGQVVESEEMQPVWFNFEDIPYKEMWEDDIYWLPYILSGKKIIASFTFENDDDVDGTKENHVVKHTIQVVPKLD